MFPSTSNCSNVGLLFPNSHQRHKTYRESPDDFIADFNAEVVAAYTAKPRKRSNAEPFYANNPRIASSAIELDDGPEIAFITPYSVLWTGSYHCTTMCSLDEAMDETDESIACRLCADHHALGDFATFEHTEVFDDIRKCDPTLIAKLKYCPPCLLCGVTPSFRTAICTCCGGRKAVTHSNGGGGKRSIQIGVCSFSPVAIDVVRKYPDIAKQRMNAATVNGVVVTKYDSLSTLARCYLADKSRTPRHCYYRKSVPAAKGNQKKRKRGEDFKSEEEPLSSPPLTPRSLAPSLSSATASVAEAHSSGEEEESQEEYVPAELPSAAFVLTGVATRSQSLPKANGTLATTATTTATADGDICMNPPPAKRRLTLPPAIKPFINLDADDYEEAAPIGNKVIVTVGDCLFDASQIERIRPDRMLSDDLLRVSLRYTLAATHAPLFVHLLTTVLVFQRNACD